MRIRDWSSDVCSSDLCERLRAPTIIPLGAASRRRSSDLPGRRVGHASRRCRRALPYLVLLPMGFAVPFPLPEPRCALTAPFHPCRPLARRRRSILCCTFRRLPPPRRYLASFPAEIGRASFRERVCQYV